MKLIELLPLIERSTVNVYEKRRYGPPKFIVLINPKKNQGCISDDLLRNKDIEETTYYSAKGACSSDEYYEDYKELIKEEYEKLGIEVLEGYE
jgi:hypothetical protein